MRMEVGPDGETPAALTLWEYYGDGVQMRYHEFLRGAWVHQITLETSSRLVNGYEETTSRSSLGSKPWGATRRIRKVTAEAAEAPSDVNVLAYGFRLDGPFPNPASSTTRIVFELPTAGDASLTVFDVLGRRVTSLVDNELDAGVHHVDLDLRLIASGSYFFRLRFGKQEDLQSLVVAR
jgi:hypothetical protein